MDFEEFKRNFELFTKIDTPEKLAICERQYKNELLRTEDEKYSEPESIELGSGMTEVYESNLRAILGVDNIKENEFYFFVRPSFEAENLLILKQENKEYLLTYIELTSNYWAKYYKDNSVTKHGKTTRKAKLNADMGGKIFKILSATIENARIPQVEMFVLDGTKCSLSKIVDGSLITVSKHSPNEASKSGRTIELLRLLSKYTQWQDQNLLKAVETEIKFLD